MPDTTSHPFPDDIPTLPLLLIEWDKLLLPRGDRTGDAERSRLYQACHDLGFFYLKGLPVDPDPMFDLADEFFACSQDEKDRYEMGTDGNYFGYKKSGAYFVDKQGSPDRTEFLNISKDNVFCLGTVSREEPRAVEGHRQSVKTFMEGCHSVAREVLKVLSQQLQLKGNYLLDLHKFDEASGDQVRLTHSLAPAEDDNSSAPNVGAHTDFGSVTVLFNRLGGLQVLTPKASEWKYVKPLPGCAIINLGDALVKMTGNLLRSNIHRVVAPPGLQRSSNRESIVYFCRPNNHIRLAPIPSPLVATEPRDAKRVDEYPTSEEWIKERVTSRLQKSYKGEESYEKTKGTSTDFKW
ncbi:hypothetical protein YB2330_001250 [Saitoella coloradoensis]